MLLAILLVLISKTKKAKSIVKKGAKITADDAKKLATSQKPCYLASKALLTEEIDEYLDAADEDMQLLLVPAKSSMNKATLYERVCVCS